MEGVEQDGPLRRRHGDFPQLRRRQLGVEKPQPDTVEARPAGADVAGNPHPGLSPGKAPSETFFEIEAPLENHGAANVALGSLIRVPLDHVGAGPRNHHPAFRSGAKALDAELSHPPAANALENLLVACAFRQLPDAGEGVLPPGEMTRGAEFRRAAENHVAVLLVPQKLQDPAAALVPVLRRGKAPAVAHASRQSFVIRRTAGHPQTGGGDATTLRNLTKQNGCEILLSSHGRFPPGLSSAALRKD
jgi:hypothetical protein